MQKRFLKYFWDGDQNISEPFKLRRILEYASFPDLIHYPFDSFKSHIGKLNLQSCRLDPKRREFIKTLLPNLPSSKNWDELLKIFD